jgi:hypothetical protein
MFRFIAKLLIISLLTLNIAWTGDDCSFAALDNAGSQSTQIDDKSPTNLSDTNFDCDDWCHAWANPAALLGIVIVESNTPAATINSGFYKLSYGSLPIAPPFHPPIV